MVNWKKHGFIFNSDGQAWWAKSYATVPTVCVMEASIRVYFSSLDENNYGRIGYVDLDKTDPKKVLYVAPEPVLDLGELGTFDDCGVVPSCIIEHDGTIYLYYIGFQRAERVPYMLFTGLATSSDGTHFERYSRSPILDRTDDEPFSRSAPHILIEGNTWRMWYWSCIEWSKQGDSVHYNNVIRYAESSDGIHWNVDPNISIEPTFPDEYAAGRPWVIKTKTGYKMWYSIRSHSKGYAFGYAESPNGITWQRLDAQAGLNVSDRGWDSEMVCYPSITLIDDTWHLFYNGNQHGRSGFGYATWKETS